MHYNSSANTLLSNSSAGINLVETSQQLLLEIKKREPADSLIELIANSTEEQLTTQLATDTYKKAFWINLYNAFVQISLKDNGGRYQSRNRFFSSKQMQLANRNLSLDDIEHGILRCSKVKWGLGYLNKPFPSDFEKRLRLKSVDYRIHFALNCGAKSCPPIAFYSTEKLDSQLEMATKSYLAGEVEYDKAKDVVLLPAIMGWFRGDFGGKRKILELLYKMDLIPQGRTPRIRFKDYDWRLVLENYTSDL